ncbi:MAG: hypothetical protein KIT52_06795 [Anaerolineae bacterium]|nr:hypothetical protein [Anaerolineae bacterium]
MSALNRFRDWWLGRVVWVGVPLLFGCCFCSLALVMVAPTPDVEPTAKLAERSAATAALEAMQEPVKLTAATILVLRLALYWSSPSNLIMRWRIPI